MGTTVVPLYKFMVSDTCKDSCKDVHLAGFAHTNGLKSNLGKIIRARYKRCLEVKT